MYISRKQQNEYAYKGGGVSGNPPPKYALT